MSWASREEVGSAELAEARANYDQARSRVRAARRLVLAGEEGASVLATAEWQEHTARRRLDLLEARAEIADMPRPGGGDAA